jgi:hypothetical protein
MEHIAVIDISVLRRRKVTIANKRRWLVVSLAAGLLWLGSGAAYVAAQTVASASVRRITAKVADDRVCRTLATELEPIPDTTVEFFQDSDTPDQVVVTFIAEWPKPNGSEIPPVARQPVRLSSCSLTTRESTLLATQAGCWCTKELQAPSPMERTALPLSLRPSLPANMWLRSSF